MKKILVLIISLLCVCSCSKVKEQTSDPSIVVEKITYEQHDYLIFSTSMGKYIGINHDPDCWCMIDYE